MPQNYGAFLMRSELTWRAILWSQTPNSTQWPTMLDRKIRGKS